MFGSKREEGTGVQRKLYDDLHSKYHGYQIKKDEMGGECGKYGVGGEEICVEAFVGETWRNEKNWKTWAQIGGQY